MVGVGPCFEELDMVLDGQQISLFGYFGFACSMLGKTSKNIHCPVSAFLFKVQFDLYIHATPIVFMLQKSHNHSKKYVSNQS